MRLLLALVIVLVAAWPSHAARVFTSGCEENTFTGVWNSTSGTAPTIVTTDTPHSGTYHCATASGAATSIARVFPFGSASNKTSGTVWTRFYWKATDATPATNTTILEVTTSGGTAAWSIQHLTTGALRITNSVASTTTDTTATMSDATYYRIEVAGVISDTVGSIELRLYSGDSTSPIETISTTGADTCPGACTGWSRWSFGKSSSVAGAYWFDDVAINDNTGSFQNSWPGPGKTYLLKPDGDVSVQFTPTASTNASNVDDVPGTIDDGTTQVTSTTLNHIDRLSLTALGAELAADADIVLLHVVGRVGGDGTSGTRQMRFKLWDEGGTECGCGPTNNLNDINGWNNAGDNGSSGLVYDAGSKTKANVASFDAGYENMTTGVTVNVSALWVNVEWLEAAAASGIPNGAALLGVGR